MQIIYRIFKLLWKKEPLRLLNSMYGINNSGKLFAYELTEWLLKASFIQYQCQMNIYYKYAPDRTKIVV